MIEHGRIIGYRKLRQLQSTPQNHNIPMGYNDAGKSTLLEAITLGLTGRQTSPDLSLS